MTKLFAEGDKSRAICDLCGVVETEFGYRTVPFSDGSGTVPDILVGVCCQCGAVVSVPPQSTPAIKKARDRASHSVEALLPAIYVEALDLACYTIEPRATSDFRKKLVCYYIHDFAGHQDKAGSLGQWMDKVPVRFQARAGVTKRLSFKVTDRIDHDLKALMQASRMTKTDVLKSVVLQINQDIVERRLPKHLRELRMLAAVG